MTERIVRALTRSPLNIVIIAICLIWILPSLGLLISSFRPAADVTISGWWSVFQTPFKFTQFTVQNYIEVITDQGMGRAFINSLFITIPSTIIPILVAAFAAYAFAWMEFRGRNILFIIIVALLVVPLQMTLIPILRIYNRLGLSGSFFGVWMAHTGYGLPFATYLFRNYFGGLPRDLFESAYIDGASRSKVFFRIVLPLSVPAIASIAIFQFLWVWNDLLVALIYLGGTKDVAPMTLQVSNLVGYLGRDWHLLTAAAFLSMALPLVVFFAL
ncbi:carbohydrate ABC transporter permease, partial [Candidatus Bipolaricaulota bacterium]|nr:carbohydrate ABC transporter permease [Candidatus Bipolaricaulota bacterium]